MTATQGRQLDNKNGVRRVVLTTPPALHPFSLVDNTPQNYYCYSRDMNGFQVEIDLQAMPPGVTLDQLAVNQVWWVEKRTSLYRLYLYGGVYDETTRQITTTAPLPTTGGTINGNLVVTGNFTVSGAVTATGIQIAESQVTNLTTDLGAKFPYSGGTISGNLVVASGFTVTGTSTHIGASTFSGSTTVSNNLTVASGLTISGNLSVSGTATFATPPSVMGKWQTTNTSSLPLTSTQEITQTVSGYSNYLITLNSQCTNGDTTTGRNAVVILKENTTSSTLTTRNAGMNANSPATVSITWLYTGATAGTSYTFAGFLNQGGSSAGTAANTITILGFN